MRRHEDFDPGQEGDGHGHPVEVPRSGVRPRWIVAGIAAILLVVFAVQNSDRVDVDFLFFDAQVRVVTVIIVAAFLGFVVGWFVGRPSAAGRKAMRKSLDT